MAQTQLIGNRECQSLDNRVSLSGRWDAIDALPYTSFSLRYLRIDCAASRLAQRLQFRGKRSQREEKMIVCFANQCDYCRSSIVSGQRWVREKTYDVALHGRDPNYHRYHAEPFAGQERSCWEKRVMEREIARTTAYAA
jgi:hypothetical protein